MLWKILLHNKNVLKMNACMLKITRTNHRCSLSSQYFSTEWRKVGKRHALLSIISQNSAPLFLMIFTTRKPACWCLLFLLFHPCDSDVLQWHRHTRQSARQGCQTGLVSVGLYAGKCKVITSGLTQTPLGDKKSRVLMYTIWYGQVMKQLHE